MIEHLDGNLYVFEGPDGVGKSTLSTEFVRYLSSTGRDCKYIAFPGKQEGTLGEHVYRLHHDSTKFGLGKLNPTSLQALHIAAHIEAIEELIQPALKKGTDVILDRYWWSTQVYGRVLGADHNVLDALINAEKILWKEITPFVVFLVTREGAPHENGNKLHDKLKASYYELAKQESLCYPVEMLKNDQSVKASLSQIVDYIALRSEHASKDSSIVVENSSTAKNAKQLELGIEPSDTISTQKSPRIYAKLAPAVPTKVFDTYWKFAAERQEIFFRKAANCPPPWTTDSILLKYKFTNAYRASDRVSQYLIRNVIYKHKMRTEDLFFRIILFKLFNKIETWELLEEEFETLNYSEYSFEYYDHVLTEALAAGKSIFSSAYIMPSGKSSYGYAKKHRNCLKLLETMMQDELPSRICDHTSMREAFLELKSYPLLGDFLAYQFVIDINYSEIVDYSENEFVVPGPGAKDGVHKCFSNLGGLNETDVIRLMTDRQEQEFERLDIQFKSLWSRPLQLIDCQNLFCEVDKYSRLAHPDIKGLSNRTRIKQRYQATTRPIHYWFPPKWNLNENILTDQRICDEDI